MPAFSALIFGRTMAAGGTLRRRMPTRSRKMPTLTPAKYAVIHSPTGTK